MLKTLGDYMFLQKSVFQYNNDLYVKSEKYKWKVRKVGLLGVVIGLEGIKIEKKKIKGVLE